MWLYIILMLLGAAAYAPIYWAATPALRRHIGPKFALSFAILIFAGMFMWPGLFYLLCIAVMVFLTRGRIDAVCRFILLGALIPSSPYAFVVGGVYIAIVSTLDVLGFGLLLAVLFKRDRTAIGRVRGFTVEDAVALLFFVALHILAIRMSEGAVELLRKMLTGGLLFLLPYFLIRRHIRSVDEYRVMVACFAVASAILSVFALYEAAHGWSVFATINEHLGEANVGLRNGMMRGGTMRASTTMLGALMLGCYLAIGWIAMACSRAMFRTKLQWIAGCVLVFAGELAAQSRGSVVCIAVAAAMLLVAYRRPALAAISLAAAGGGTLLLFAISRFSPTVAGFLNLDPDRQKGDSYDYRQVLFRRGMEEAARHRWTGADFNTVVSRLDDIRQGQGIVDFVNTYLLIYLVMGLLAIVPLAICLVWMYRTTIGAFRRSDDGSTMAVRAFALAGMTAMLVQLSFMSFVDRVPVLFAATLVGMRLVVLTSRGGRSIRAKKPVRQRVAPGVRTRPLAG